MLSKGIGVDQITDCALSGIIEKRKERKITRADAVFVAIFQTSLVEANCSSHRCARVSNWMPFVGRFQRQGNLGKIECEMYMAPVGPSITYRMVNNIECKQKYGAM